MIQILLHNLKMDPLVSLHYYAPVCAAINVIFLPFTEGLAPFYELRSVGFAIFFSNAMVAFLLNVAAVFLVGVASGLVLTLAGVFKVAISVLISTSVSANVTIRKQVQNGYSHFRILDNERAALLWSYLCRVTSASCCQILIFPLLPSSYCLLQLT